MDKLEMVQIYLVMNVEDLVMVEEMEILLLEVMMFEEKEVSLNPLEALMYLEKEVLQNPLEVMK
jgi:hypothetical protein